MIQLILPLHECAEPNTDEPLHSITDSATEPLQSVADSAVVGAASTKTS
jgi:hypothetical protein